MPGSLRRAILLVAVALAAEAPGAVAAAPPDLWLTAQQALSQGRWAEAHQALSSFVEQYPQSPHVPEALLALARTETNADRSRVWLERLRAEYPRTDAGAEAVMLMARADLAAGMLPDVPGRLRSLGDDKHPPALRRRALLLVAEIERRGNELHDAERDFSRVLELGPTDAETARALYGLAGVARARRDYAGEERFLSDSFQRFPEGDLAAATLWQWASALRDQGLEAEAKAKLLLLERRFPGSAEALAAREGRAELAEATRAANAPAGAPSRAVGPPQARQPATESPSAADSSDAQAAGSAEHTVRAGRFPTWEEADSLRARLASHSPVALRVVPDKASEGPYAVESGIFADLANAVRFAGWVEAETGFGATIVSAAHADSSP